jgi:ribonuclease HI
MYYDHNGQRREQELSGGLPDPTTTNNVAELSAVEEALKALQAPCEVRIYTDSQNVIGWLTGEYKCNERSLRVIVGRILARAKLKGFILSYVKVSGHSGDPLNERADKLAKKAARLASYESETIPETAITGVDLHDALPPL